MTTAPDAVGVVGLGNMGLLMAGDLLAAGFGVRGYDVRPEAVDALARAGGTPTASPAEAVAGAPVAITSLPSVAALREVVGGEHGLASAAPDGHLSIAERIPGKTYAWLEVFPCRVADEKRVAEMRVGVSEVSQVGELAINFRRYGGHLVAQPQIQCEIREPAPVVLQIPAKDGLSNITG